MAPNAEGQENISVKANPKKVSKPATTAKKSIDKPKPLKKAAGTKSTVTFDE